MTNVYISGPITNNPDYKEDFARAEQLLKDNGFVARNPLVVEKKLRSIYREPSYEEYLKEDIRMLLDCDGIYFLEGSEDSKGCKVEAAIAEVCGIPTVKFKIGGTWK